MTTTPLEFTGREVVSIIAALQRSIDAENVLIAKSDNTRFVTEAMDRNAIRNRIINKLSNASEGA